MWIICKIEQSGEMVPFQIDSGGTVNVITASHAPIKLEESTFTFSMYRLIILIFSLLANGDKKPVNIKQYRIPLISRRPAESLSVNYLRISVHRPSGKL